MPSWHLIITLALAFAAGCGRIAFDPVRQDNDAANDDAANYDADCPLGPWSNIQPIPATASAEYDRAPTLSPDQLVLVFSRTPDGVGSVLYIATRPSITAAFEVPRHATELEIGGVGAVGPQFLADGRTLSYSLIDSSNVGMRVTAHYRGDGTFDPPIADPFPFGGDDASETPDELEVFYTVKPTSNDTDLGHATRSAPDGAWQPDALLATFNRTGNFLDEGWPSFDPAHQDLYFEVDGHVVVVHRAARGAMFGPVSVLTELQPEQSGDPFITADSRSLWFESQERGGAGNSDLFMATRICQ